MIKCARIKVTFSGAQPCENPARYVSAATGAPLCGLCELDVGDGVNISRDPQLEEIFARYEHYTRNEAWTMAGRALDATRAELAQRHAKAALDARGVSK